MKKVTLISSEETLDQKPAVKTTGFKKVLLYIKKGLVFFYREFLKFPNYLLFHPIKGFDLFKREKKGRLSVAIVFVILNIVGTLLMMKYGGFEFVYVKWTEFQPVSFVLNALLPVVVFVLANWSVTTIMDGKGKMKEIFMVYGYSLFPILINVILNLCLTNFATYNSGIVKIVSRSFSFLSYMLLFFGIMAIHEYGLLKTISTFVLTLIAVGVILFTALLFFDLFQKIIGFIYVIYKEITLRGLLG